MDDPAVLVAVQVYTPECLWLTDEMLRKLARGPAWLVDIVESETETESPCKVQLILNGISPLVTMQET